MANSDQLARRAYQAYARTITPAGGEPPPSYVDLDGRAQRAWRVAADAIVDALADEHPAVREEIHAAARRSLAGEPWRGRLQEVPPVEGLLHDVRGLDPRPRHVPTPALPRPTQARPQAADQPVTDIVAVDLAAKMSAACWMDDSYTVINQWDSWHAREGDFIETCTALFDVWDGSPPAALVVEDLPARVPWMGTVKDVCRLQGRIIDRMATLGELGRLVFLQPGTWRSHFIGLERGTGPEAVVPVAAELGYTPPELSQRVGKGEKAKARKVATDYCAAYLIARWAIDFHREHGHLDAPRTSKYPNV